MNLLLFIFSLFLLSGAWLPAQDEAVRAFLGMRATRVELEAPSKPMFYVTTFAKFQKGKFVGFGFLGTGLNQPQAERRYIEVAWAARDHAVGYVFIDPLSSSSFTIDPFFEHLTLTMIARGNLFPKHPQFRGFEVIGDALSPDGQQAAPKLMMAPDIERELQAVDYAILILYREFENQADYLRFLNEFQKSKRNSTP